MLAPLGFAPIDHQVTDQGVGTRSGLPDPGSWATRDAPLITAVGVKPASTTAPTHLVPIADPPDPIPTQRLDLLKPGRAKARISHNNRFGNRPAAQPATVAETPGVCAACPYSPTYAPLHTRWQSDRSPPHSPATDNDVCRASRSDQSTNNTGRVRAPMSGRHRP